jgi:hypothetical protein
LKVAGKGGGGTRPDFDACAVGGIGHADVINVDVLHVVNLADVLAETAHTDAMRSITDEILHDDVGAVGLEGDAVVAVVDVGVLDYDVVGAVRVPSGKYLAKTQYSESEKRAYPSVFFAGFLLTLPPSMSMFENTTSLELATSVYHCGLYLNFRSSIRPPWRPIVPKRIGRRM